MFFGNNLLTRTRHDRIPQLQQSLLFSQIYVSSHNNLSKVAASGRQLAIKMNPRAGASSRVVRKVSQIIHMRGT